MAIVPDTKSWTWVLERPCPECGFDAASVAFEEIPALIRADVPEWQSILRSPDVRTRPDDSTWSILEYAAHVRDVHSIFADRLELVLTEEDPLFANWDQDATAVVESYNTQNPALVSRQLGESAATLADAFDAVSEDQSARVGRRSDGARFTVVTLARYYIHDPIHHLWDVRR